MSKVRYSANTVIATDLRSAGGERYVGSNGEINAIDKRDLLAQQANFLTAVANNRAVTSETAAMRQELAKKRKDLVQAAFASKEAQAELGAKMGEELYQAANREGFMRRFLLKVDLQTGTIPRIQLRSKDVTAVCATSPIQVQAQIIRDKTFYPPEFQLVTRPFITNIDLQQAIGDILEEKFIEGQEGITVAEDRIYHNLLVQTVGAADPATQIVGNLTAGGLMDLRNKVGRWQIPTTNCWMANDVWSDIVADPSFQAVIDPVSKYELLMTGQLGTIYGMSVSSDAYRMPEHKVLSAGEIFILGDPVNHGAYTDRGGVVSSPIDSTTEHTSGRGWLFEELLSITVANSRSVARAIRTK